MVARLRAAQADLVAFRDGELGTLRIGTFQSVGAKILPRLHREFSAEWPKIELRVIEGSNEDELIEMLVRGELDATFAVLPVSAAGIEAVELMRDPYVLAVPAASKLAKARTAKVGQLDGLDLIGFRQSGSIAHIEQTLREHGVQPRFVFRSDDNGIVQGMVGAGAGSALVPVLALAWSRDRYRSPAARAFVEHARRIFAAFATPARQTPVLS